MTSFNKKGRSIRIRIETGEVKGFAWRVQYKKGRSIRIRIETPLSIKLFLFFCFIKKEDPLE